jgi:hypothetical protein
MKPDERISKLPKWVQDHIRVLENTVTSLKEDLGIIKGEINNDTPIVIAKNVLDEYLPLPDKTIEFRFGGWNGFSVRRKPEEGQVIQIHAHDSLFISPSASNAVDLISARYNALEGDK